MDIEARTVAGTTKLDGAPGELLLGPDGTLFVALRGSGHVAAFRVRAGGALHEIARRATANEPVGLALTPDRTTVLVTSVGDARLEAFRASDLEPMFGVPLPRDPHSVLVSDDGARAFVSHATGSVLSVVALKDASPVARTVSLDARERRRDFGTEHVTKPQMSVDDFDPSLIQLKKPRAPNVARVSMKRQALQGFALAAIGDQLFLPEALVMTSDNQRIPTGYGSIEQSTLGTNVPFVARVGIADEKLANRDFSGPDDKRCFERKAECLLPRAAASDGKKLYVACLDSDEVLVIDPEQDAEHGARCNQTLEQRRRIHAESPSGLAIDAEHGSLIVYSSFSRRLSVAALAPPTRVETISEIALPRSTPASELLTEGRRLFHRTGEPKIARDGRACASCHVDGRDDGLVWPTPLGKRQTPMLAGRIEGTGPYGWNGEHDSLVIHIKSTVSNLEGKGVSDRELQALAEYVSSMRPPARRAPPGERAVVAQGKAVFDSNEAGCSSCHIEDSRFTDHETHLLPEPGQASTTRFDTPSLAFVGQTAPYFHDGRFKTLEALVDGCDGVMGKTRHLTPSDRSALVTYLRSL